jgi:two-component system, NtrC family, sensor kinase
MKTAHVHPQEELRLNSLNELNILDSLPEKEYDQITYLVSQICNVPIALISLVDKERQWFKSKIGIESTETSRDVALCAHAILNKNGLVVPDTALDSRFSNYPEVESGIKVRFYAGVPLLSPDGLPIGTVCAIDTVSRHLTQEQIQCLEALSSQVTELLRLRLQIKELENMQRLEANLIESARLSSLGEIAGGLAHEINNPLSIIRGLATTSKRKMKSGKIDSNAEIINLEKIEHTVDRIAKIIKGLRAYSRNAENDPIEKISVTQLIDETLELCKEKFKLAGIKVEIKSEPDIFICARTAQVSQILMNLINNSFDAISDQPNKWIYINVKKHEDKVKIEISDSGKGIPADLVKKIMLPFFTTKEVGKGTGLGLSIAQGLAQSNGGQLEYVPDAEHTTFSLELSSD